MIIHSRVAKLLHLAKRDRPEMLSAIIFLRTRITVFAISSYVNVLTKPLQGSMFRKLRKEALFNVIHILVNSKKRYSMLRYFTKDLNGLLKVFESLTLKTSGAKSFISAC